MDDRLMRALGPPGPDTATHAADVAAERLARIASRPAGG
jgi:hypothetical protein